MHNATIINTAAMAAAKKHQDNLTKPTGSLGVLETITVKLAGMFGEVPKHLSDKKVLLFAGDHGIVAKGVSAYPQEVTAQMLANFASGGAAINVLAAHVGADVVVCDIGTKAIDLPDTIRNVRIAPGTADISTGPAMSRQQAEAAVETGFKEAEALINGGSMLIGLGEMGIGNTTIASAITAAVTGCELADIVGPGTGIDSSGQDVKRELIRQALDINQPDSADGLDILTKIGGFEFGGHIGAIFACAEYGIPVIIDGFITCASALLAKLILPDCVDFMIASHLSAEPGHRRATDHLGIEPMLYLDMRLGEGTGAALSMSIIDGALKAYHNMATFDGAGVDRKASNE